MKLCVRCGKTTPNGLFVEGKYFPACKSCKAEVSYWTQEIIKIREEFIARVNEILEINRQECLRIIHEAGELASIALNKLRRGQ